MNGLNGWAYKGHMHIYLSISKLNKGQCRRSKSGEEVVLSEWIYGTNYRPLFATDDGDMDARRGGGGGICKSLQMHVWCSMIVQLSFSPLSLFCIFSAMSTCTLCALLSTFQRHRMSRGRWIRMHVLGWSAKCMHPIINRTVSPDEQNQELFRCNS